MLVKSQSDIVDNRIYPVITLSYNGINLTYNDHSINILPNKRGKLLQVHNSKIIKYISSDIRFTLYNSKDNYSIYIIYDNSICIKHKFSDTATVIHSPLRSNNWNGKILENFSKIKSDMYEKSITIKNDIYFSGKVWYYKGTIII